MDIDSSPTSTDSTHSAVNIRIDGIDIDTEHLDRNELVEKLLHTAIGDKGIASELDKLQF